MKLPKPHTIAIRSHDMYHGLSAKVSGLFSKLKKTRLIGACAQLSTVIKDQEVVENYQQLEVAAGEIGIDDVLLEKCLEQMQEIEFVRIKTGTGGDIRRIDVKVPLLRGIYDQLGELWGQLGPSDFEKVTVALLDELTVIPQKAKAIQGRYNLNADDFDVVRDIGCGASFIGNYISPKDGEEIWYSPLHWDENPEKIFELCRTHPSFEISKAFKEVRDLQGLPADRITDSVLTAAIALQCLPTPAVTSMAGKKHFVFTPMTGIGPEEKSILNKARAIIACVRYGEHYGSITKIHDPKLLVEILKARKYLKPHSETLRQYETLRNLGVGRISRDKLHSDRYWFHLIDNDENMKAIDLALQMLTVGEPTRQSKDTERAKQLLLPGYYEHPTAVRVHYMTKEKIAYSKKTVEKVNDLIRGVSSDLI
jgi:hypothetical protein